MGYQERTSEKGFVLATALVLLSLMTLMAVAMFFTGKSSTQISSSAQSTTEGHYYAETAVNYMIWAMHNDADFDGYDAIVAKSGGYGEPAEPVRAPGDPAGNADATEVGDAYELDYSRSRPGPNEISDVSDAGLCLSPTPCQVMYFDNSPMGTPYANPTVYREICLQNYAVPSGSSDPFPNCVNLADKVVDRVAPTLYNIHTKLPRYIVLEIADGSVPGVARGTITPSIPALINSVPNVPPYHAASDKPNNGAIVWLTTGNDVMDFEVDSSLASCSGTPPLGAVACDKNHAARNPDNNPSGWLNTVGTLAGKEDQYGVVVYAIGYVGGRPSSIIRAQIK